MKKLLFLIYFFCSAFHGKSQVVNWLWAKNADATYGEKGRCIAVDAQGNSYFSGTFRGSNITFDVHTFGNPGPGYYDCIFTIKYNPSGQFLWGRVFGGTSGDDACNAIAFDDSGYCYMAGQFRSASINSGGSYNAGGSDIFVIKYNTHSALGGPEWVRQFGGTGDDEAWGLAVDHSGNIFLTGGFTSPDLPMGSDTLHNVSSSSYDIFVTKLDSSGNTLWSHRAGNVNSEKGLGIAADLAGNCYVTGSFASNFISFGSTVLYNGGSEDMFAAKYDSNGTVVWARKGSGIFSDIPAGIACDPAGNSYVTGTYNSTSVTFGTTTLTNAGSSDIFMVKYDSSGVLQWANTSGGINADTARGICVDAAGNMFTTGSFNSPSISFGASTVNNYAPGNNDLYIAKHDAAGNPLWAVSNGTADDDYGAAIGVDAAGNCISTGVHYGSLLAFGSYNLWGLFGDFYIAKLSAIPLGIENTKENVMQLYPNPSSSTLYIDIQSHSSSVSIAVFDSNGKKVLDQLISRHASDVPIVLDLSGYAKGLYLVQVLDGDKLMNKKIMVD